MKYLCKASSFPLIYDIMLYVCMYVCVCAYDNEINLCLKYIFKVHRRLLPKKLFSTDFDFSHYLSRILQYGGHAYASSMSLSTDLTVF